MSKNTSIVLSRHYSDSGSGKYDYKLSVIDRLVFNSDEPKFRLFFSDTVKLFEKQKVGDILMKEDNRRSGIREFAAKLSNDYDLGLAGPYGDERYYILFSVGEEGAERLLKKYFGKDSWG